MAFCPNRLNHGLPMSLLLPFASPQEAAATIATLGARPLDGPFPTYRFDGGTIVVTGVGAIAAASAIGYWARHSEAIWALGIAGSLSTHLPLGTVVEVGRCSRHIAIPSHVEAHSRQFAEAAFPTITLNESGAPLVTVDYPIHTVADRDRLAAAGRLVDMEGYAIAAAAQRVGVPCRITRIISDLCQPGGAALIRETINTASERFAELVAHSPVLARSSFKS